MKAIKKISTLFLTLCLMISCMSLTVFAADGRISFSDPTTKVGDNVEVTCAVRSEGNNMDTVEVDIDFETEYLSFKSGEGATEGESGELILSSDEGGTDVVFTLTFQALKEGDTKVTIESYRITGDDGDSMDFTMGNSAINIAAGDPSKIEDSGDDKKTETASGSTSTNDKTATIEVNGVQYTLTGDFPDATIPTGYVRTDISLGGEELPMLESETSGAVLAYLVDSSGTGDFFYYDQETDSMWPYAEVSISDSTTLLLLSDTSEVRLPEVYKEATLTIDNKDFPTWQDTSNDQGYYIIYGLASDGDKGYYRYDSQQGTYQRFEVAAEEDTEEAEVPAGVLGQIEQFVQDHMFLCLVAAAVILVFLLLMLLIVGVKLHNRNRELDDLYDEYGIDEEDEEPQPTPSKKDQKKAQKKAKKAKNQEAFEEDYAEDLYGDDGDYDEDEFDDEYTEEILSEDDLEDEDFFNEEYDSGEDPLDLSENLTAATGKLTLVEDEDEDDFEEDDEEPVDDRTRIMNDQDQKRAAKAAAAGTGRKAQKKSAKSAQPGRSTQSGRSAQSAKSAKTASSSKTAKSSKAAKSAKSARSSQAESSAQSAQPTAKSSKKTTTKKTTARKAAAKNVDDDLADVPEDADIFAGYDKREELTLDDLYGEEKKKKKKGHQEDDDSFKVDFIDLD